MLHNFSVKPHQFRTVIDSLNFLDSFDLIKVMNIGVWDMAVGPDIMCLIQMAIAAQLVVSVRRAIKKRRPLFCFYTSELRGGRN